MLEYLHLRKLPQKNENEKKNNLSSEMKVSIHSLMMGSSGPDDRGVSTFSPTEGVKKNGKKTVAPPPSPEAVRKM